MSALAGLPLVAGVLAVLPAAPAAAAPGGSASIPQVRCSGDGVSGNRVQMVYVWETGTTNRYSEREKTIKLAAWATEQHVYDSAAREGQQRWVRWVTNGCQLSILQIQVPAGQLYGNDVGGWTNTLKNAGLNANNRIYAIFGENNNTYCGFTWTEQGFDPTASLSNNQNNHPFWMTFSKDCMHALTHELAHAMYAMIRDYNGQPAMPNANPAEAWGHCTDGIEVLCGGDAANIVCPHPLSGQRWDCNRDDYFAINPQGPWLPTHWNAAQHSKYLDHGGSTTTRPDPLLLAPQALTAVDVEGTSIAFTWKATSTPVGYGNYTLKYDILRNGTVVATVDGATDSTNLMDGRVTGLSNGTNYQFTVRARFTYNGVTQTSANSLPLSQTTNNSASPAGGAEAGAIVNLSNDRQDPGGAQLAMDVFWASHDENATVGQWHRNYKANETWTMAAATGGTYTLTSQESGKCLTTLGGATTVGTPIVQATCNGSAAQRWTFAQLGASSSATYHLKTAAGTCIGAQGNSTVEGAILELATCSTTEPTQRWSLNRRA